MRGGKLVFIKAGANPKGKKLLTQHFSLNSYIDSRDRIIYLSNPSINKIISSNMNSERQTDSAHLDHALQGIELDNLMDPDFNSLTFLKETLEGLPSEELEKVAIKILQFYQFRFQEKSDSIVQRARAAGQLNEDFIAGLRKEIAGNSNILLVIFDTIHQLGTVPTDLETFVDVYRHLGSNPMAQLMQNPEVQKWGADKAHIYGIALTMVLCVMSKNDLTQLYYDLNQLSAEGASENMIIVIKVLMIWVTLVPTLMGVYIKLSNRNMKPIIDVVNKAKSQKNDPKTDFVYESLQYLTKLLDEHSQPVSNPEQKKIEAKAQLVRTMVRKVLGGEEPRIEPAEYGGKLSITQTSIHQSAKIDFKETILDDLP